MTAFSLREVQVYFDQIPKRGLDFACSPSIVGVKAGGSWVLGHHVYIARPFLKNSFWVGSYCVDTQVCLSWVLLCRWHRCAWVGSYCVDTHMHMYICVEWEIVHSLKVLSCLAAKSCWRNHYLEPERWPSQRCLLPGLPIGFHHRDHSIEGKVCRLSIDCLKGQKKNERGTELMQKSPERASCGGTCLWS